MRSRQQRGNHKWHSQGDHKGSPLQFPERLIILFVLVLGGFLNIVSPDMFPHLFQTLRSTGTPQQITNSRAVTLPATASPVPFMHRPYYGSKTILQRTTSFVDHDKPWYANDGIFVRYDGAKWTNVSIGSCTGGVNCYDGHNGYDLNLWYEPVLSVAAGTVIRAGWYNPLDHNSSLGIWAAVDHGNGYVTAYGHMSALTVSVGDQIGVQWQVGTSGTTGSSTGPHLHMATYYLPNWDATDPFGWSGNYADPNVVPDNYLWVDNPGTSSTVPNLSGNGSAVYPGATLVDDSSSGWSSSGTWNTASANSDIQGNLHWTSTTSGTASASATWRPTLSATGYYEVGVFVNDNHASSSWAPYTIYSADPHSPGTEISHKVYLDESHIGAFQGPYSWENTGPQWVSLGTYYFSPAVAGRVVLSNATGENGLQVSADGVEFAPVSVQATTQPPAPTYGFAVTADTTPTALLPGSTSTITLTVKNNSNFSWNATGDDAVQLIYRWLDAHNTAVATGSPLALPQRTDPGSSVTVATAVQVPSQVGSYTLQWDLGQGTKTFSQQGAQAHNDTVQVVRYAEVFAPTSLPGTLPPGATLNTNISVQNKGPLPWPAAGNNAVTLGYRWLDANGNPVDPAIAGPTSTGNLVADVAPGGSTPIPITLRTPLLAGSYSLIVDLQQQGTWFSAQGATPLKLSLTITPNLSKLYYFAEGYTGAGTSETLTLTNPAAAQATITVTYLYQNGTLRVRTYTVPAQSLRGVNVNAEAGANQAVSMIVQGNQPFAAERTMYSQYGTFVAASDSMGATRLSTTWYFAEGNTTYGWNTLLAVLNPAAQAVTLKVNYLLSARAVNPSILRNGSTFTIPAHARATIALNAAIPNQQFGMIITASGAVLVERPEYLVISPLRGGSSVIGATAPQKNWYFGGGNTSAGFNERFVLANPANTIANVQLRYLTASGQVVTQTVGVPAQSRVEVNVNSVLQSALHATALTANIPIIAERQDFFTTNAGGTVPGSTTTMGSSDAHTSWYLARGDTSSGHVTSLALANPNAVSTLVQVVYYQASGAPLLKTYTLAANSRLTINLSADAGANSLVGIAIYSSTPVVVEQFTLFNLPHGTSGGYSSMAYGV